MSKVSQKISFLNGEFLPHQNCLIHIEDRGFQFSDGIYEVILFKNGRLIDQDWHLDRLFYSLGELNIKVKFDRKWFSGMILELFEKNNLAEGSVYLQITRGSTARQQHFPEGLSPTISATVSPLRNNNLNESLSVISHQDIRWQRCDIKSISLLASSMLRQKAVDAKADDVIMVRDEYVSEASFANVFIVDGNDTLVTRNLDNFVLGGITRKRIIQLAKEIGIKVEERKFSLEDMLVAKEVFLSSTTLLLRSVAKIDGKTIRDGEIGEITKKLQKSYQNFISNE
ncbi:MAG: D-alanine transaminase [Lentimonas sp.]|jgi:D-alanine transaminase